VALLQRVVDGLRALDQWTDHPSPPPEQRLP
jgi:hypothetical protein